MACAFLRTLEMSAFDFAGTRHAPSVTVDTIRNLRIIADARRGKGKRGGLRVIYFWLGTGGQFWLFAIYDKDEMDDLGPKEKSLLRERLKQELESRK